MPLVSDARAIRIALAEAADLPLIEDIRFSTGRRVEAVVASTRSIEATRTATTRPGLGALVEALPRTTGGRLRS